MAYSMLIARVYPYQSNRDCKPFRTTQALEHYVGTSVPPSKIVLATPLYVRAFENTDDLGKLFSGSAR
jgi:hypothetical protein